MHRRAVSVMADTAGRSVDTPAPTSVQVVGAADWPGRAGRCRASRPRSRKAMMCMKA